MSDINRNYRNRDSLKRLNYPRQTYAFSGIDFGDAATPEKIRQKLNIDKAPMVITPLPPGAAAANDIDWPQIYGASMDCVLSIMDGVENAANIIDTGFKFASPYFEGLPHSNNSNLYTTVTNKQQIHFIVGKSTIQQLRQTGAFPVLANEARSLCMRAPMQMCGWGKTIGMRPTDPEPANLRKNDESHKFDRSSWKIGPLDARWDEKRKMWRAFNDLIADDAGQNLGTLVFSTNPDNNCGFPFLRAKLEDIWSVRKTFREVGAQTASKRDDTTKSALLVTKLSSKVLEDNRIGLFSDVLLVYDGCMSGFEATCGTESTTEGKMAISVSADFFATPAKVGPIVFSLIPAPDKVVLGQMFYQGTGCGGSWVPGVEIDICDVGGVELGELFTNDKNLQDAIIKLCKSLSDSSDPDSLSASIDALRTAIESDVEIDIQDSTALEALAEEVASGFDKTDTWTKEILEVLTVEIYFGIAAAVIGLGSSVQAALNQLQDSLIVAIADGDLKLATDLAANCDCIVVPLQPEPIPIILPFAAGPPVLITPPLDLSAEVNSINTGILADIASAIASYEALEIDLEEDANASAESDPVDLVIKVSDPCSGSFVQKDCT